MAARADLVAFAPNPIDVLVEGMAWTRADRAVSVHVSDVTSIDISMCLAVMQWSPIWW